MDLQVLKNFLAVAREGNITNAANSIHIAQPSLSRQIKNLEDELGQKLFIRGSHSVTLTPEGMLLRKRAEDVVAMLDKIHEEFSAIGETISGDIYIGGGETYALHCLLGILKDLQAEYPGIRYHMYSGNSVDVTERLDRGLLDFGILLQPADVTKYNYINLPLTDRWGVIMRNDSPLAAKEAVTCEDLMGLPLLLSRQAIQKSTANNFIDWFDDNFDKLNVVGTFNLVYNAALMVERGMGYMVSIDKIANTSPGSSLSFRPLYPPLEAELAIVWRKHQTFSKPAEKLLERLRERL